MNVHCRRDRPCLPRGFRFHSDHEMMLSAPLHSRRDSSGGGGSAQCPAFRPCRCARARATLPVARLVCEQGDEDSGTEIIALLWRDRYKSKRIVPKEEAEGRTRKRLDLTSSLLEVVRRRPLDVIHRVLVVTLAAHVRVSTVRAMERVSSEKVVPGLTHQARGRRLEQAQVRARERSRGGGTYISASTSASVFFGTEERRQAENA